MTGFQAWAAMIVLALSGGSSRETSDPASGLHAGLATFEPTPEATIDLRRPPAAAAPQELNLTSLAQGDRFVIAKFAVDAPLTYRRVGRDGQMPNPDGPDDVQPFLKNLIG